MQEVVKFEINTPIEVTLRDERGKRVEGRYGDQVMYSLLDNRVMYVPPYVEQRFQELAISAGEPLLLCKQRVKDGDRNRTEWSIWRAPRQSQPSANGTAAEDPVVPATTPDLMPAGRETGAAIVRSNGEATAQHLPNGAAKREEQPSGNSTAPMAQELALHTNHQHQRQDSAGDRGAEIVCPVLHVKPSFPPMRACSFRR